MEKYIKKIVIICDVLALIALTIFYGPWDFFRSWYITTAMSTSTHKYLAYMLYDTDTINEILSSNIFTAVDQSSDPDLITFTTDETNLSELEKQILDNQNNDPYKIIEINGGYYTGWITVIYDATRLSLVVSKDRDGNTVSEMAEDYNALVAVNGGGYVEKRNSQASAGGLVVDGEVYCESYDTEEVIALTQDGKLLLSYSTVQDVAEDEDVLWALHFSPFLIVNGQSGSISGNAGGNHPRTAIGQREDGIIILLTVDGRGSNGSFGINYEEMINIFENCGCINAANLDGGGSTTLYADGQVINDPSNRGRDSEREVYNALIYV